MCLPCLSIAELSLKKNLENVLPAPVPIDQVFFNNIWLVERSGRLSVLTESLEQQSALA
jgi:hypothetical protein